MANVLRRKAAIWTAATMSAAIVMGGVIGATTASAADKIVLKYAAVFPPIGAQADGAKQIGKYLDEFSGGKLDFQFYPSSQLGNKIQSVEGLRNGSIEMTDVAATDLENFSKLWSIFALPFVFNDGADAIRVVSDPRVANILNKSAEDIGVKIIAWWNMGERSIFNAKRPVATPKDLSGVKIRVMQSPILAKAITAMGATGIPMSWGEVYTAVQQGTIDGLENSPPVIAANKFWEVGKYFSLTQQFIIPDPQMISLKVFNKLPGDLQEAVVKAGMASQKDFNEKWEKAVSADMKMLRDKGVQINEVDKAAFRKAVDPMVNDFLKSAGGDVKTLYTAIVAVRDGK